MKFIVTGVKKQEDKMFDSLDHAIAYARSSVFITEIRLMSTQSVGLRSSRLQNMRRRCSRTITQSRQKLLDFSKSKRPQGCL